MRTRGWPAWMLGLMTALMLAACGGGGGGAGSGNPVPTDNGGGSGGSGPGSTPTAQSYMMILGLSSGQVAVGGTLPLSATVIDNNGNDVTTSTQFNWSSSN